MFLGISHFTGECARRCRSHGSRKYNKPEIRNVSIDGLLPFVNLQLGLNHNSYETVLPSLEHATRSVRIYLDLTFCWCWIPSTSTSGIILDITSNRLFKAVRVCDYTDTKIRPFLKIKFANNFKGIDALNLSNVLIQKSVQSNSSILSKQGVAMHFL